MNMEIQFHCCFIIYLFSEKQPINFVITNHNYSLRDLQVISNAALGMTKYIHGNAAFASAPCLPLDLTVISWSAERGVEVGVEKPEKNVMHDHRTSRAHLNAVEYFWEPTKKFKKLNDNFYQYNTLR